MSVARGICTCYLMSARIKVVNEVPYDAAAQDNQWDNRRATVTSISLHHRSLS